MVPIELISRQAMLGDPESIQIQDMIISLGMLTNAEAALINGGTEKDLPPDQILERHTCKNLLPSGLCAIYDTRPKMCRAYGVVSPCEYKGCTFNSVCSVKKEGTRESI